MTNAPDEEARGSVSGNANATALALIVAAALLAGWVDARFPGFAPGSFVGVALHMGCALLAIQLGMRALGSATHEPAPLLTALLGAALPATTYLVLSAFWIMKLLHSMLRGVAR